MLSKSNLKQAKGQVILSMRQYGSIVDVNHCLYRVRRNNLLTLILFTCQHPPLKNEVLKYMSEAIISRRGSSGGSGGGQLRTEIIASNVNWTVPNHKGNISVRIFGGGSAYMPEGQGGGGSGWMNNGEFSNLTPGQIIPITIGDGDIYSRGNFTGSGGTSSFGTYLSANGGSGPDGGAGGPGGDGYQFGGGGGYVGHSSAYVYGAGNGGIWGGGGGYGCYYGSRPSWAGDGGTYGGGGGGAVATYYFQLSQSAPGGNGGTYGGGGGGGTSMLFNNMVSILNQYKFISNAGIGGINGGNGGNGENISKNGINTIGNTSIQSNLRGNGRCGDTTPINIYHSGFGSKYYYGGGGGGYGGRGGSLAGSHFINTQSYGSDNSKICIIGGGGGGYGGNGGNGAIQISSVDVSLEYGGGGGGGYGGNGGNGIKVKASIGRGGGGGGYFSDGDSGAGGGGYYTYCHGGSSTHKYTGFGSGAGAGAVNTTTLIAKAIDGGCIIQYYV